MAQVVKAHDKKITLGEAGEFLVLSRLLRRGIVASQGPRTWKADDILTSTGRTVQVKTTDKGPRPVWMVGASIDVSPSRFFALVDYRDMSAPVVYVLPSQELEEAVSVADRTYYELRPASKPWGGRTIENGWRFEVPGYGRGWLDKFKEAWDPIAELAVPLQPPELGRDGSLEEDGT